MKLLEELIYSLIKHYLYWIKYQMSYISTDTGDFWGNYCTFLDVYGSTYAPPLICYPDF